MQLVPWRVHLMASEGFRRREALRDGGNAVHLLDGEHLVRQSAADTAERPGLTVPYLGPGTVAIVW